MERIDIVGTPCRGHFLISGRDSRNLAGFNPPTFCHRTVHMAASNTRSLLGRGVSSSLPTSCAAFLPVTWYLSLTLPAELSLYSFFPTLYPRCSWLLPSFFATSPLFTPRLSRLETFSFVQTESHCQSVDRIRNWNRDGQNRRPRSRLTLLPMSADVWTKL